LVSVFLVVFFYRNIEKAGNDLCSRHKAVRALSGENIMQRNRWFVPLFAAALSLSSLTLFPLNAYAQTDAEEEATKRATLTLQEGNSSRRRRTFRTA
jgi:hypothetical protein